MSSLKETFRRGLTKSSRNRSAIGDVVNATRADGCNYMISRFTCRNEFGKQEVPVIKAAITKDIKKAFANSTIGRDVRIVNITLNPLTDVYAEGYVSIEVM